MSEVASVSACPCWRAEVYGLLARYCHEPPAAGAAERLGACAETATASGRKESGKALEALACCAREEAAAAVKQDFNDLFMVPGPKYLAPYESVYADPPIEADGKLAPRTFGKSTFAVRDFYGRVGLAVSRAYTELPDFVGLEFACLEFLCAQEDAYARAGNNLAVRNARKMQGRFLSDHASRWIPALARRAQERAATGFYRALAALMTAWLREESEPCPNG